MSTTFQIISRDGRVYSYVGPRRSFHGVMLPVSMLLTLAWNDGEDTFDALHKRLAPAPFGRSWNEQGGTVNPFGDSRGAMSTTYTFDLAKDILFYSDPSQNQKMPLQALRELREGILPTIIDFTPFDLPSPPELNFSSFHPPYWTPPFKISHRNLAFVGRLLSDFNFQWRHILRCTYAESTFQILARAVLDIATLDFNVVEESEALFERKREYYISGNKFPEKEHYVSNNSYPSWQPHGKKLFSLGQIVIILEQDLEHALALIPGDIVRRNDIAVSEFRIDEYGRRENVYLLLSLRHVMLCRVDHNNIPFYTQPANFMNGIDSPSSVAITLILQALAFAFPPPHTMIHDLPLELQDQVLDYAGEGRLDSARVGCALGLGSPFDWRRAKDLSRAQGPMERHTAYSPRDYSSPVEHEIYFGKTFSGLAYK